MRIPFKWLKEYVEISISPEELAQRLDRAGIRVENIERKDTDISNIISVKIVELKKHPNADKLNVAVVDTAGGTLQVVTAAKNLSVGDIVPLAKVGAVLADKTIIKETKLRGIDSYGMMCSAKEIGIDIRDLPQEEIEGVMKLAYDVPLGMDAKEIFGLDDTVFNFEVFANRPDCLSISGIAVEVSAVLNSRLKLPLIECKEEGRACSDEVRVKIKDTSKCSRYIARVIKNVKIKPSPWWMQNRLKLSGIRPVNNVVDITNYVMLEVGNPLHAFDFDKIEGRQVIVRQAEDGQRLLCIDGEERILDSSILVISDVNKPVALAGLSGGKNTEITQTTCNVLLEAALFEPACIRRASIKTGLRSESSRRFEKGLDWHGVDKASARAAQFLSSIGSVSKGIVEEGTSPPPTVEVLLRPGRVNKILGGEITEDQIKRNLSGLNFKLKEEKEGFLVEVPSTRKDISQEIDLIEEIARLTGYDSIPASLPQGRTLAGSMSGQAQFEKNVCQIMKGLGLTEAVNFSLVSPRTYEDLGLPCSSLIEVINPLTVEQKFMRDSILPQLVLTICNNLKVKNKDLFIFEVGNVYSKDKEDFKETAKLGIALYGRYMKENSDFYSFKGITEAFLKHLNIKAANVKPACENLIMHPGMSCEVKDNDIILGTFGVLNPALQEKLELEEKLILGEFDLTVIKDLHKEIKYSPISKFPKVTRDIAIVVDKNITSFQVEEIIKIKAGKVLSEVFCFDVYEGSQIPKDSKSMAYSLVFQSQTETLTEEYVNEAQLKVLRILKEKLGAKIREK